MDPHSPRAPLGMATEERTSTEASWDDASGGFSDPSRPSPPRSRGRFRILGLLGEGGMGEVYRARDLRLDREVALKRLKSWVLDARVRARLVREAQALAQLSHPNVIEVYDVELEDDFVLVMELVEGPTLAEWMKPGPRPWREALPLFLQAGRGLEAAHAAELVHRDFKPGNVILGNDGRVRVMDFGLARTPDASLDQRAELSDDPPPSASASHPLDDALTATGMVVGTPAYMAPEQFQDLPADGRTDQYAFCVTLWQALCGARPFQGSYIELGRAKVRGPGSWPREIDAPRRLVAALVRGMAPEPRDRWPSMTALLSELEAVSQPVAARRRGWALAAGGLAVGLGAVLVLLPSPEEALPGCEDEGALPPALWTDAARSGVKAAIERTEAAHAPETWARVSTALDDYASAWASEWASARRAACEAANAEPTGDAVLEARVQCLRRRRRSFEALVQALSEADDEGATKAIAAVEQLPSLAACAEARDGDHEPLLPDDPTLAERVTLVRGRLARVEAFEGMSRCDEAGEELRAVAPEVDALEHAPLYAELALLKGRVATCVADFAAAEQALRDAYFLATEQGRPDVASQAALELVHVVGVEQARHEEGLQWSEHARAELARAGDQSMQVRLLEHLGSLHHAAGRYEDAEAAYAQGLERLLAAGGAETTRHALLLSRLGSTSRVMGRSDQAGRHHEQALDLTERLLGKDHPSVTLHMVNLANVANDLNDTARAEQLLRQALVRSERDHGPSHPQTLRIVGNLALTLSLRGEMRASIPLHERAIAGMEQTFGVDHPNVAMGLNNLGIDQLAVGDVDGALRSQRRALQIREQALGPDHALTASSIINLAEVELKAGHVELAAQGFARALPVLEESLGPDAFQVSYPLVGLGRALLAKHEPSAAVPPLERGLVLRAPEHTPPPELCEVRFALGRALWESGGDRKRAVALVRDAVAAVVGLDGELAQRTEAEAWLREHADDGAAGG
ncbi:serine/threonine-protein kinase [Paraliomyxa miuraensis]|uniref:serine/threonine-protein kinase n=1 Tax=Paraliomyxa miuraensis TaxID=376150 RepID=UPI002255BAC1|nr:serine/threonine-protein kinase [Paraliomyxa miuraensis]MCX4244774.1 tetratricopeptide repeat protein [Paraliomyxa miuraensis]